MVYPPQGTGGAAAGVPAEGDYTTWTQVWVRDYGAGVTITEVYVDNQGRCYATDIPAGNEHIRDYGGTEQNIAGYGFYVNSPHDITACASITYKYVLDEDTTWNYIVRVWREGVLIWTLDTMPLDPDYAGIYVSAMSPNGKFIALVQSSIATGDWQYLMLYEGS